MADKFDADSFWSLDDLIPKKKYVRPPVPDTETVEIEFDGAKEPLERTAVAPDSDRLARAREALRGASLKTGTGSSLIDGDRIKNVITVGGTVAGAEILPVSGEPEKPENLPGKKSSESVAYTGINELISKITVDQWETEYRFHTRFVMSAKSYFDLQREEAPFVPFYTTVPNYGQMSRGQFDCFVCWRTHIRRGEAAPTSPGYVSLLFFEIVNLPELIPPETGSKYLQTMWKSMSVSPRMPVNPYMEWFIDYLAVNNLPVFDNIPANLLSKKLSDGRAVYLTRNGRTDSVAEYFCMYSSEFEGNRQDRYDGEGKKLFEKLVRPSVINAITRGVEKKLPPFDRPELVFRKRTIEWPAYSGAICAWQNKKRVTMEYTDLIFGYAACQLVSDLRKYSENLLRKHLGIRSRYHIRDLNDGYKALIDAFYRAAGITGEKKTAEPVPEYERLYEAETTPLSVSAALDIERDAWKTTGALTDNSDFKYEETETSPAAPADDRDKSLAAETVAAILDGKDVSAIAKRENVLADTLIDRVNEFLYDVFGDNVIENGNIDCYRDEVREWLSQQ